MGKDKPVDFRELAEKIYCEINCKKCDKDNTKYGRKLNEADCIEKLYMMKKAKQKEDDGKTKDRAILDIRNDTGYLQDILRKNLEYLYSKFNDTAHPFSQFSIERFDEKEISNFVEKLFYFKNNSNIGYLLQNISKEDIDDDLSFLYDLSDKNITDKLLENLIGILSNNYTANFNEKLCSPPKKLR